MRSRALLLSPMVAALAVAGAPASAGTADRGLDELWSEFPLDPATAETEPQVQPAPVPPAGAEIGPPEETIPPEVEEPVPTPEPSPRPAREAEDEFPMPPWAIVSVGIFGLAGGAVVVCVYRRRLARAVDPPGDMTSGSTGGARTQAPTRAGAQQLTRPLSVVPSSETLIELEAIGATIRGFTPRGREPPGEPDKPSTAGLDHANPSPDNSVRPHRRRRVAVFRKAREKPFPESDPESAPEPSNGSATGQPEVGGHLSPGHVANKVGEILEAAQAASEQIRADASEAAATIRREAESEAAAIRGAAQAHASQTRQAAEAYASQHRLKAEEQAQMALQEAESQADATREASNEMARELETEANRRREVRARQEQLRAKASEVEEWLTDTLEDLKEIVRAVEEIDVLAQEASEGGTMLEAIYPARRRSDGQSKEATSRSP